MADATTSFVYCKTKNDGTFITGRLDAADDLLWFSVKPVCRGVVMEIVVTDEETFYALHDEFNLSMLVETVPVSLQLRQRVDQLLLILQELDDLIESEGGLLIP